LTANAPTFAIVGAGAWGTALAVHLAHYSAVRLYARDGIQRLELSQVRENRRYLPGIPLPSAIAVPETLAATLSGADLAVIATPAAGFREALAALPAGKPFVWLCKGFITAAEGPPCLPHALAVDAAAGGRWGVLSGPSFALEVARRLPTALTLASRDGAFAQEWAAKMRDATLRIYSSDDVVGVEVGGAIKNVLAIAAGICDGLGFGANARAALITRGLAEMGRLSQAMGGRRETLMGLAGLGDLVLTCTGELSRNRRVGLELAAGVGLPEILAKLGHVAEGVSAAEAVQRLVAQHRIEMPICSAVHDVLGGSLAPREAVLRLLQREPGSEAGAQDPPGKPS
jgi:glycerol-3-phosphate dehydrogenase (NAD(P)+)